MLIGCHSLVFGSLPAREALAAIERAGFEVAVLAQIAGQAEHAAQLTALPDRPRVVAIDVASDDVRRGEEAIACAARLGVPTVIAAPGGRPGGRPRTRFLAEAARRAGLVPAVTPRAGSAVWNAEIARRLAERAPGLRLWPDTSHLARAGDDIVAAARLLAPYSAGWFVRDYGGKGSGPGAFEDQVPGRGRLDLVGVMAELRGGGFDRPVVFLGVGHLPGGVPTKEYPLERLRDLAGKSCSVLRTWRGTSPRATSL